MKNKTVNSDRHDKEIFQFFFIKKTKINWTVSIPAMNGYLFRLFHQSLNHVTALTSPFSVRGGHRRQSHNETRRQPPLWVAQDEVSNWGLYDSKNSFQCAFLAISAGAGSMGAKGSEGPVVVAGSPRRRVCEADDAETLPGAAGGEQNGTRTVSYTWLFKLFLRSRARGESLGGSWELRWQCGAVCAFLCRCKWTQWSQDQVLKKK